MTQREFLAALFIRDLLGGLLAELSNARESKGVLGEISMTDSQSAVVRRATVQAYAMADACLTEAPPGPSVIKKV